uniref:LiaI-LiaF-like domain-containing protein n=1 Tax=Stenotrophomonas sp. SrG TaxID=3414430 RepID=UPI003CE9331C
MRSNLVAAIVLILVGLVLLASHLGWTNMNLGRLLLTWWPVILVAVGIGLLFGRKSGRALPSRQK